MEQISLMQQMYTQAEQFLSDEKSNIIEGYVDDRINAMDILIQDLTRSSYGSSRVTQKDLAEDLKLLVEEHYTDMLRQNIGQEYDRLINEVLNEDGEW